jgi:hypothetical protein
LREFTLHAVRPAAPAGAAVRHPLEQDDQQDDDD